MKKTLALGIITISLAGNALAYYQAEQGRWLNRDPVGEQGGVNVYGFVDNSAIGDFDLLGLKSEEDKKCKCCCAESIEVVGPQEGIISGKSITGSPFQLMGHSFFVRTTLTYHESDGSGGDCKLEWLEKTNLPYYNSSSDKKKYPGRWKWTDMYALMEKDKRATKVNEAWNSRPSSDDFVDLPDTPSVAIAKRRGNTKRTLKIKVKITSAPNCGCSKESVEVSLKQRLVVDKYSPKWDESYLKINGKNHEF